MIQWVRGRVADADLDSAGSPLLALLRPLETQVDRRRCPPATTTIGKCSPDITAKDGNSISCFSESATKLIFAASCFSLHLYMSVASMDIFGAILHPPDAVTVHFSGHYCDYHHHHHFGALLVVLASIGVIDDSYATFSPMVSSSTSSTSSQALTSSTCALHPRFQYTCFEVQ